MSMSAISACTISFLGILIQNNALLARNQLKPEKVKLKGPVTLAEVVEDVQRHKNFQNCRLASYTAVSITSWTF
jgi:hypothetical protein